MAPTAWGTPPPATALATPTSPAHPHGGKSKGLTIRALDKVDSAPAAVTCMHTAPGDHMLLLLPSSLNSKWCVVLGWHSLLEWAEGARSDPCMQLCTRVATSHQNGLTIALLKWL